MLGHILTPEQTKEAEEELAELPDGAKWVKKKEEPKAFGRKRFRDEGKPEESVGSSQPWVGLLRAK